MIVGVQNVLCNKCSVAIIISRFYIQSDSENQKTLPKLEKWKVY